MTHFLFFCMAAGTFGFFGFNVLKIWKRFQIGVGPEEGRMDNLHLRVAETLTFGLLQPRMFKDVISGIMHTMIFWGFITVSLGTLETLLYGIFPTFNFTMILGNGSIYHTYLLSQDLGNAMVALAITYALSRRLFFAPKRLQGLQKASKIDGYIVLCLILGLVLTTLIYMGAKSHTASTVVATFVPVSAAIASALGGIFNVTEAETWDVFYKTIWWLHCVILFSFTTFLPYSKHQHLIWALPNIFFRKHTGGSRLRPMEFKDDAESFGAGKTEDFTWKQLLDGYTCVECGRCTEQCPATNTGKPLDPRLIIHHLKESMHEALNKPKVEDRRPLIEGIVSREELWSCTTCGACMEACPLYIEHIPAIVDMRRYMTMTEGQFPPELQNTFKNLENNFSPWAMPHATRGDWAKDLNVSTMAEKSDVDYLFWVGCAGSYDDRYKKVSKSIVKIMQKADISFSILGTEEKCNGDTARRLGNEYLANAAITENIAILKKYNVKKVVTGCPHCFNTIKNEYPDFGFKAEVIHHSQLIEDLIQTKKIAPENVPVEAQNVTYHDSCYLGRHNSVYKSPRESLQSLGNLTLIEMPRNKEKGFCCGAGGGRMWMEENIGERVNVNRAKEAIATGASMVATACPFCLTMMTDGVKSEGASDKVQIKDIAEIIAESYT